MYYCHVCVNAVLDIEEVPDSVRISKFYNFACEHLADCSLSHTSYAVSFSVSVEVSDDEVREIVSEIKILRVQVSRMFGDGVCEVRFLLSSFLNWELCLAAI